MHTAAPANLASELPNSALVDTHHTALPAALSPAHHLVLLLLFGLLLLVLLLPFLVLFLESLMHPHLCTVQTVK